MVYYYLLYSKNQTIKISNSIQVPIIIINLLIFKNKMFSN